ncbi:MAG TPA: hypothetical protein VFM18_18865 [Methanosarcina sp.]|nr:hypothetical protein [Methanosarcina sp.]
MSYPYLIQGKNIVVVIDNKPHTVSSTHITYQKVLDAIKAGEWETVRELIDPKKTVINYGAGNVSIQGDKLFWKGMEFHNALATRMIKMLQDGFPIEPMVLFMENLMQNPSNTSVKELYGFLEKNNLPITSDGYFLAYKRINKDFTDVYTGKVINKPVHAMTEEELAALKATPSVTDSGVTTEIVQNADGKDVTQVSMDRNRVDDNAQRTCSVGLHFCSQEYLAHYPGEVIVTLKINPADVVSIPVDYNNAKGRAYRYQVVGVMGVDPEVAFTSAVQDDANAPKGQW